ncbi:hypothetical protein ACYU03_01750 [Pseudomonas sp. X10]
MANSNPLTLLTFALLLAGCSNAPTQHTSPDWEVPSMELGGDRGLPLHPQGPCKKRGCDNHKLFFNPGQPEPSVNSIHRGW